MSLDELTSIKACSHKHTSMMTNHTVGVIYPLNLVFPQTHEEFRQIMNGYKRKAERKFLGSLFMEPNFLEAPRAVDWREKGYVTPVKDQVTAVLCVV